MTQLKGEGTTDNVNDGYELMPIYLQDLIKKRRFSVHNAPPNMEWFLTKVEENGETVGVASRGEVVMAYGPAKSRKSTLLNCIVSSAYTADTITTLGFQLDITVDDTIYYFDTEMPITAFHRRQMKLNKMSGYGGKEDMPNFQAYSLKPYSYRERIQQIEHFVLHESPIGVIVIDQMADLVSDINDRESVSYLIDKLSYWSDYSQALIIGSIHVTRNTTDMTGVLGHELAKKMDSGLYLEKMRDSKETKVKHLLSRENDIDDFYFYHNLHGYPVLSGSDENEEYNEKF